MEENLKILVVENNQVDGLIVSLAQTRTNINIEIDEIKDVNNAFFAIMNNYYDCVFLDYHLLNEDGLTLIDKVRASGIKIPLIILIDSENEEIAREWRRNTKDYPSDYYFDEYIWKGWNEHK